MHSQIALKTKLTEDFLQIYKKRGLSEGELQNLIFSKDVNMPSVAKIKRQYGVDVTIELISRLLVDLVGFFNTTNPMSADQIIDTAEIIADKYYYFRPSDFNLCFKNCKAGKYGQAYNRLDGQVILLWIEKYNNERVEFAITQSEIEDYKHKDYETNAPILHQPIHNKLTRNKEI